MFRYNSATNSFAFVARDEHSYVVLINTTYEDEIVSEKVVARTSTLEHAMRVLESLPAPIVFADEWRREMIKIVDRLRDKPIRVYKVARDDMTSISMPKMAYEIGRLCAYPCVPSLGHGMRVFWRVSEAREYAARLNERCVIMECLTPSVKYTLEGECITDALIPISIVQH